MNRADGTQNGLLQGSAAHTTGQVEEGSLAGLWYMAVGQGDPIVYLPGFGPHNQPLTGFARQASMATIKWLARYFRVYWINRREGLKHGATIGDLAEDYSKALRSAFAEPVDVMGYSMGGMLGLQLAADHPEAVRRLVVGGITHKLAPAEAASIRKYVDRAEAGDFRGAQAALVASAFQGPLLRMLMSGAAWLLTPLVIGRDWDPSDAVIMLRALLNADLGNRLPDIKARTLLVAGENDLGAPPHDVKALAASLPDARFLIYPRKGHAATMTSSQVADDVRAFLYRSLPDPGR